MDDEHKIINKNLMKTPPPTSISNKNVAGCQDTECDKREDDDSISSRSSTVSVQSHVEVEQNKQIVDNPPMRELKLQERKNKKRTPPGRIEKRCMRRQIARKTQKLRRKMLKQRITKRLQTYSTSTVYSVSQSSRTGSPLTPRCQHCGHSCCRRRFQEARRDAFRKRRQLKKLRADLKKKAMAREQQEKHKKLDQLIFKSESIQAGSTCLMLSTLCEKTSSPQQDLKDSSHYCEITPEIIYESIRRLTMWKQDVATMAVLEYVKRNYPVCQDIPALFEELEMKLQVAAVVGFIAHTTTGRWRLVCALQEQRLSINHVTMFWITYADTMKPVTRKTMLLPTTKEEEGQTNTQDKSEGIIKHDYI